MDLFKKANIKYATKLDWNCSKVAKRRSGDTQRLHQQSRRKLKEKLQKDLTFNY